MADDKVQFRGSKVLFCNEDVAFDEDTCCDPLDCAGCACLKAVVAGIVRTAEVNCECVECELINDTWYVSLTGDCEWEGFLCTESTPYEKCRWETTTASITQDGNYYLNFKIWDGAYYVHWRKDLGAGVPDCTTFENEELAYFDSSLRTGEECDYSASTATVSFFDDTPCEAGHSCTDRSEINDCDAVCFGASPSAFEVTIPNGWVFVDEEGCGCTSAVNGWASGTFLVEDGPFLLPGSKCGWVYADYDGGNAFCISSPPPGPLLQIGVAIGAGSLLVEFGVARSGTPYMQVECVVNLLDYCGNLDCFLAGEEIEVPFFRDFGGACSDWDGSSVTIRAIA